VVNSATASFFKWPTDHCHERRVRVCFVAATYPLERSVTGLLRLLDAVTVVLVGLVVGGVVGGFRHDCRIGEYKVRGFEASAAQHDDSSETARSSRTASSTTTPAEGLHPVLCDVWETTDLTERSQPRGTANIEH